MSFFFFYHSQSGLAPEPTPLMSVVVRDRLAVLNNYPDAWKGYDRIRFRGPPAGLLPVDTIGTLAPNEQLAPLFCRALKLHAQAFLEVKAGTIEAAQETRKEYVEVVSELMRQLSSQRAVIGRRFS